MSWLLPVVALAAARRTRMGRIATSSTALGAWELVKGARSTERRALPPN